VNWEHKIDVIFDRRLLYRTADLRSKKTELIRLSKTKDDVRILSHETNGSMIHKFEAAGVVGLGEPMNIGESVGVLG